MTATPLFETDHPYNAAQGNYYVGGGDAHTDFQSWEDFLSEMDDADLDLNLIYRWDWHRPDPLDYDVEGGEEIPSESLRLFYIGQRKAKAWSMEVFNITREQEPEIRAWLAVRAEVVRKIWAPLLDDVDA